ncbi:MAG: hypothetical protein KA106_01575 [Ferrovibrio sp.]|nr:hypothetical protein [Ferrovibrio sp.]
MEELPINPLLPLCGIALILVLVWLTGGRRRALLADAATARGLLAQPETGFQASEIALSRDGSGAIAMDAAGRLALVLPVGARLAARLLKPADIASHHLKAGSDGTARLELATKGPASLRLALLLPQAEAQAWSERLP